MSSQRRIYLDNAATSFPKPPAVHEAMLRYGTELGASPGRGSYAEARRTGELMHECRERINTLIHGEDANHVIFTLNTTDALNMAIRGLLQPGDHCITTWMDHNSVLRPYNSLVTQWGLEVARLECDPATGLIDPDTVRKAIRPNTRLIACVHGSNVTGTIQPVGEIGAISREHDIPFLVDAAQTLGHMPLDVQALHVDLLAFPGHKGLLGPLGTGGLYIRPGIEKRMRTSREGGTGSRSEVDTQPDFMPDRFEAGSHNAIGIIGLSEGVKYILDRGIDAIWAHEQSLIRAALGGLTDQWSPPGLTIYGPPGVKNRCGVFSIRVDGFDHPQSLSDMLENGFGILTRSGIHCAPLAHQTIGTHHLGGTTRLSFGPFVTVQDVQYACDAIGQICLQHAVQPAGVAK